MSSIPRLKIEQSLVKKGFILKEQSEHSFYYFCYKGEMTKIRTKISRGSTHSDYDDILLNEIKKQLKFENKQQLLNFINCPFTEDDYIELLKQQGFLN